MTLDYLASKHFSWEGNFDGSKRLHYHASQDIPIIFKTDSLALAPRSTMYRSPRAEKVKVNIDWRKK